MNSKTFVSLNSTRCIDLTALKRVIEISEKRKKEITKRNVLVLYISSAFFIYFAELYLNYLKDY